MAFISTLTKLSSNKTLIVNRVYYINKCLKSYSFLSSNRCYSQFIIKNQKIDDKLKLNVRYISSALKSDATLSINPSPTTIMEKTTIDLSDFVVPEPPTLSPPVQIFENTDSIEMLTDLTLSQLNLASSWFPMGWCMHALDALHVVFPWWASIAILTLTFRMCIFPFVVMSYKNGTILHNIGPKLHIIQAKLNDARLTGDNLRYIQLKGEEQQLFKKHGFKIWRSFVMPLVQAPFFASFYFLLRRMADLPVDSLFNGGVLWFTDLTVCDPYYLLPIMTYGTLFLIFEKGTEFGNVMQQNSAILKNCMRAIPIVLLPITAGFPAVVFVYWGCNNLISLAQVSLLRVKIFKKLFKIPERIQFRPEEMPNKDGFISSIKKNYENAKTMKKLVDHRQLDDTNFKKAAIGPIKRTYKYDPTKVKANQ